MTEISIVIPLYNASNYLSECIDSILQQTYNNWELILVDDGSQDSTPEICNLYAEKDSRIYVYHRENQGVSASRNFGLQRSKGRYVLFVDGDDYLHPNSLEALSSPLNDGRQYDIIIGGYKTIGGGTFDSPLLMEDGLYLGKDIKRTYANGQWYLMPWNKLISKSFIEHHFLYFDTRFALHEDYIWSYMLANEAQSLYVRNDVTYYYRINEGSVMSNTSIEKDLVAYIEAFLALKTYVKDSNNTLNPLDYKMIEGKKNGVIYSLLSIRQFELYKKYYPSLRDTSYISPITAYKKNVISLSMLIRDLHYILPTKMGAIYKKWFYNIYYKFRGKNIEGAIWK